MNRTFRNAALPLLFPLLLFLLLPLGARSQSRESVTIRLPDLHARPSAGRLRLFVINMNRMVAAEFHTRGLKSEKTRFIAGLQNQPRQSAQFPLWISL